MHITQLNTKVVRTMEGGGHEELGEVEFVDDKHKATDVALLS